MKRSRFSEEQIVSALQHKPRMGPQLGCLSAARRRRANATRWKKKSRAPRRERNSAGCGRWRRTLGS